MSYIKIRHHLSAAGAHGLVVVAHRPDHARLRWETYRIIAPGIIRSVINQLPERVVSFYPLSIRWAPIRPGEEIFGILKSQFNLFVQLLHPQREHFPPQKVKRRFVQRPEGLPALKRGKGLVFGSVTYIFTAQN